MTRKQTSPRGWLAQATSVGELIRPAQLHPAVLAWAKLRRRSEIWSVAFSGGADSLALLLLLWAHWPERRAQLVALHFNHRLRGRAAEADEKYCRRACAALGLQLVVGRWRGQHQGASEAEARAARQKFFAQAMQRLGSRALWLAHQQDDIAESIMMRLARGSGTGGLAAPRPVQPAGDGRQHVRPLLTLKKTELIAVLHQAGVKWREDASNAGRDYFRNRIRHDVLPAWSQAAERDALGGAALARERLEEDDVALESWVESLAALGRDRQLSLRALAGLPRAIVRRALHRWLLAQKRPADLSRQGFEALLAAVERGQPTRFSLGTKSFAVIREGKLSSQYS